MIPASKSAWFCRWFSRHAEQRVRRNFSTVYVRGLDAMLATARTAPVLVISNHTSWWDPLVAIVMTHRLLRLEGYAMMHARQLARLRFLARVGGYGVDRRDPRDGLRALRYTMSLLDRPGRVVWLFPQGDERPAFEPMRFFGGSASVSRACVAKVVPAAIVYNFGAHERPELYVSFGDAVAAGTRRDETTRMHELAVSRELVRIHEAIADRAALAVPHEFTRVWAQPESTWRQLGESMLNFFMGPQHRALPAAALRSTSDP